jgi:hypothetical protein
MMERKWGSCERESRRFTAKEEIHINWPQKSIFCEKTRKFVPNHKPSIRNSCTKDGECSKITARGESMKNQRKYIYIYQGGCAF